MPSMSGPKVFAVRDEEFHWEDVVLAARYWGEWDALVARAREGIACRKAAGDEIPEGAQAAANEFRYERDLVGAEETEAWLAQRGLSADDWIAYFERALLRERSAGALSGILARHPVTEPELEPVLPAEATCSGSLSRWSLRLAGEAAVHEAIEASAENTRGEARLARFSEAFRRFSSKVVTEEAVRRAIAAHRLEWQRVEGLCARFATRAQASEAALCVREDGADLGEVAAQARAGAESFARSLDECPPALAVALQAAAPGEIVGPLGEDDGYAVCRLDARRPPEYADAAVRDKAAGALLERAVGAEIQRYVRWYLAP